MIKKSVANTPLWDDKGFKMESLEYRKYTAMRFIGVDDGGTGEGRIEAIELLGSMREYLSDFEYPIFLFHHNGVNADTSQWIGVWGRFMKADTPVPDGFVSIDFVQENNSKQGVPYLSHFAFAVFSGDMKAMHKDDEGYAHATFETVGKDGVKIPYPEKFWHGEVFINGINDWSTGYLCSITD